MFSKLELSIMYNSKLKKGMSKEEAFKAVSKELKIMERLNKKRLKNEVSKV